MPLNANNNVIDYYNDDDDGDENHGHDSCDLPIVFVIQCSSASYASLRYRRCQFTEFCFVKIENMNRGFQTVLPDLVR